MRIVLTLCLLLYSLLPLTAELIWVEGESAAEHSMHGQSWYDSVKKTELSGGDWLSHFSAGEPPEAIYKIQAEGGDYAFWLRANPIAAALSYRINGADWKTLSFDAVEDQVNLASDGKPDLRFVAWVNAGLVSLTKGENRLEVRFESKNNRHGGLDCFALSHEPFFPEGHRKPGEKTGLADPGTWAFEPDHDAFSPDALLDLSSLNEKPAGKHGYVRRSADGADFVDGSGKEHRFWAINTGVQSTGDLTKLEEHARWMAKRGVNMVRHHGHLQPGRGSRLTDVNQREIDDVWKLVAAMKQEGIYVTVSPYWASHTQMEASWGLKDSGNGNLSGLIFFDDALQAAYKGWLRALLSPENPHTGIPLAKDPTLAIFQIQNEDSLLFWTEGSIKGEQRQALGRRFAKWLGGKYGSLEKAVAAWGGVATFQGDDFAGGLVMPHPIWHLTQEANGALQKRLADQLAFYTDLMSQFNREIARYLKDDLGYEGLVNAGNWRTADQAKLLDAERMAYAVNDVIGVNRYFNGGQHRNPTESNRAGYLISLGDIFDGRSALVQPGQFPLALRQVTGHPMIVSESAWVPPLRYQTEGAFLVAAYGALTGVDVFYWFATNDVGFGRPMGKWQLSTPAQLGMFPAAAYLFRQGLVKRGAPVVQERRSADEVWSRQAPLLPEEAGFDPNRDAAPQASGTEAAKSGSVTPLAYLVGPVETRFERSGPPTAVADLSPFIDFAKQRVTSNTGELQWDYGRGLCTLNAPSAKGACGTLKGAGDITLDELTFRSENDYASLLVVALDDQPLSASKKVLIQVGTTARPYGWKTRPVADHASEITDLGGSPWNIEDSRISLTLSNRFLSSATLLDANGVAVHEISTSKESGKLGVELPREAMYVILR